MNKIRINKIRIIVIFVTLVIIVVLVRVWAQSGRVPLPSGYAVSQLSPEHVAFYSFAGKHVECVFILASSSMNQFVYHVTNRGESTLSGYFALDGGKTVTVSASSLKPYIELNKNRYSFDNGRVFICLSDDDIRQINVHIPEISDPRPFAIEQMIIDSEEIREIIRIPTPAEP